MRRTPGVLVAVIVVCACDGSTFTGPQGGADGGSSSSSGGSSGSSSGGSSGGSSSGGSGSSSGGSGSSSGSSGGSSGSSGGSSSSSGSGSSSGSSSGGSSSGADAGRVPLNHRPNDHQCIAQAPTGNCMLTGGTGACAVDATCTQGTDGRCIESTGGAITCFCTYDTCANDAACGAGQTCACHGSPYTHGTGNTCVTSNCRVDADCGSDGYCSPADDNNTCGSLLGYFCHTPNDQCINDSDCPTGMGLQVCTYVTSTSRWQCKTQGLCA